MLPFDSNVGSSGIANGDSPRALLVLSVTIVTLYGGVHVINSRGT